MMATAVDINVTSSTAGTAYVVFLADGAAPPTAAAIKKARAGSGGVAAVSNKVVTAGAQATVNLTGLTGGTSYDAYIVIESSDGTLGTVMKVDVITPPAPTQPPTLALPDLANVSTAANFTVGEQATTITFTNSGGRSLTRCAVNPWLPNGLRVSRTSNNTGCEITGTPIIASDQAVYMVTAHNATGADTTPATISITTAVRVADADGNGLIEIGTLMELNNIRYNLDGSSYRAGLGTTPSTVGCPSDGCRGYELTTDLDFDADGDGSTWARNSDGSFTLDTGDNHADYFDTSAGGWVPIGDRNNPFTAVFDGGGHAIFGLAIVRDLGYIGLFGAIGMGADIRNIRLVDSLAKHNGPSSNITANIANIGGLVGYQGSGLITASHITSMVEGGNRNGSNIGGLVGYQDGGNITASYAAGIVKSGAGDSVVGGLVGYQDGGNITASRATNDVDGGDGNHYSVDFGRTFVGGLVGAVGSGTITASHAIGRVKGIDSGSDHVGGLVGLQSGGTITASYAIGMVEGSKDSFDYAGVLVGRQFNFFSPPAPFPPDTPSIISSWGFGSLVGRESNGIAGSVDKDGNSDRPAGVASVADLTSANVPSWNSADSRTLGAWNFGTTRQVPTLSYADYDGPAELVRGRLCLRGCRFHCANDVADAPEDAIIIPNCGTLIPSVATANVLATTTDINVISNTSGTAYVAVLADGATAPSAVAIRTARAESGDIITVGSKVVVDGRATVNLTGLVDGAMYDAYTVVEMDDGTFGRVIKVDVATMAAVSAANVLTTTVDINIISDIAGTAYVSVQVNGSAAPSAAAIKASTGSVAATGNKAVVASTWATVRLTGLMADTMYDAYIVVETSDGTFGRVMKVDMVTMTIVDADGNGLIEIGTLAELNNVRYTPRGTGYRAGPGTAPSIGGCPTEGCRGYELTADLDFDRDGDRSTWMSNSDGSITLDSGDDQDDYFDTDTGGWVPIAGIAAIFEGNGHTITGLATARDLPHIGLFGTVSKSADIRNLGLVGNLAKQTGRFDANVGGLAGRSLGSITASYATGRVEGSDGSQDNVGGLVGHQDGGSITASHATGDVDGGDGSHDNVGGLIGYQLGGSITASHATGDVDGGDGSHDNVGGLIGYQLGGSITASHATGDVDGGNGNSDRVGGLVGSSSGSTTTSYATGVAEGGDGDRDNVGGLVGYQDGGSITASHAIGNVDGGNGNNDRVGGLVGSSSGSTTTSYATGVAEGGDGDRDNVGGLVGYQDGGSITASHAIGNVDGGNGNNDRVGGLVGSSSGSITTSYATGVAEGGEGHFDSAGGFIGLQTSGSIIASYAIGDADGGNGVRDYVGGLVGDRSGGSITASYATGGAEGGDGTFDHAGTLVGRQSNNSITASWGFGKAIGETTGISGSNDQPNGVTSATSLTSANVPASWNSAANNTLGAWDFGNGTQTPILNYSDYDGATVGTGSPYRGHRFHCTNDIADTPVGAILIPNCIVSNVLATTADINVTSNIAGTAYVVFLADGVAPPTATAIKAAMAGSGGAVAVDSVAVVSGHATVSLSNLMENTTYDVYMVVEADTGTFGRVMKVDVTTLRVADADGNGLIEIGTLAELNNVRHDQNGVGYRINPSVSSSTVGCPADGCFGYELTADLDFDSDGDGGTWTRARDGSLTLDIDDDNDDYFDIATDGSAGGWVPIGGFTAVFDGRGHTISGLATVRDGGAGMFGSIGASAEIRNLGLVGNLAKHTGTSATSVGGLVGSMSSGSITASYTTGRTEGGNINDGPFSRPGVQSVGGLVGHQAGGFITASHAIGDAVGGRGKDDRVGGLVGWQASGSITASYAMGDADGRGGKTDRVGGLVGYQGGGSITASYATGNADGGNIAGNHSGGLVGWQRDGASITASYAIGNAIDAVAVGSLVGQWSDSFPATPSTAPIIASWGFGSAEGSLGSDGSNDRPNDITSAADLTSINVPASWNATANRTAGAWDFRTSSQLPALNYADYDGATAGTAGSYTSGHLFHCASDSANAPDDAILIPNCDTLIAGQRAQSAPLIINQFSRTARILEDFGNVQHRLISANYYTSANLWVSGQTGDDGIGADNNTNRNTISTTLTVDASLAANLIATFDDATDDLEGIRADVTRYSLTGIFADSTLTNWNNFDGRADAAHVGDASVSTWEVGTLVEAQATGSIRIKGVTISGRYINFLMAGGADGADVGVSLYATGTDMTLASYTPSFCSDKYLKGNQHWAHFDVSALVDMVVNIEIYDRDATSDCGFITFDHFYQSDSFRGRLVDGN